MLLLQSRTNKVMTFVTGFHQPTRGNSSYITHFHPPQNSPQANAIMDTCFAVAAYTSKTAIL